MATPPKPPPPHSASSHPQAQAKLNQAQEKLNQAQAKLNQHEAPEQQAAPTQESTVTAATIVSGGSGGTAGAAVYQVGGGVGTPAQLNVTVTAGAISAIGSVANAGNYVTAPAQPAPLTYVSGVGVGVVGATVNLTISNPQTYFSRYGDDVHPTPPSPSSQVAGGPVPGPG